MRNKSVDFNKEISIILLVFLLLVFFSLESFATVKKLNKTMVFEGEQIMVKAKKFRSRTNATVARLYNGEGNAFGAALEIQTPGPNGFKLTMPSVASTRTLVLRIYGGNVLEADAQDFPIVIFNAPDLSSPDPSPPDNDLNVENIIAESIILENRNLNSNTNGTLQWNSNPIMNASGQLIAERMNLNGIALTTSAGALTWNSHVIATAAGSLTAQALQSEGNKSGSMVFNGNTNVTVIPSAAANAEVTMPPSGNLLSYTTYQFDVGVDGGVTGTFALRGTQLPINARITRAWYEVTQTFTSASDASAISIGIDGDDDDGIVAPIAISNVANPWDLGVHSTIQNGLTDNISELTTSSRNIELVLAGEALNAGRLVLFVEYMIVP